MKHAGITALAIIAALSICSCQRNGGDVGKKDLKRIFSSGVYFLTSKYEIADQASLDAAIEALYAAEDDIPIRATQIRKISGYDEKNAAYYAEIDIQGEAASGIALPSWKLTLQKGRDASGKGYYRLFLFSAKADKQLLIHEDALPAYLEKADGITKHFHMANSLIR